LFMVTKESNVNVTVSTVTFGGQTLTPINGTVAGASSFDLVDLWYLKETGIAAATNTTFVVTWSGTAPSVVKYAAATYKNVDQTTPILASSVNSTNSSTPNPLTTAVSVTSDGMAVAATTTGNTGTSTWNNGWTEGTDQTGNSHAASSADHFVNANGTDTASCTNANQNQAAIVAASLSVFR
jgi:hypothetical protein